MTIEYNKLQFNSSSSKIGNTPKNWRSALENAVEDPIVHIKHAALNGDKNHRNHIAKIPDRVGCHFHAVGNETYEVVSGRGTLYWGETIGNKDEGFTVIEEHPVDVSTGDSFIIPERYAHQLINTGKEPLIITFSCPDSHLDDSKDRTILPDIAPKLTSSTV